MKIEIRYVSDKGALGKERLVLHVVADTDIGDYLVLQTGFNDGCVTIATFETYWFPYKAVSAGDLVVLYTRSGTKTQKDLKGGRTAHFFYWGLTFPIWDREDRALVVLHAPEWISKSPEEL